MTLSTLHQPVHPSSSSKNVIMRSPSPHAIQILPRQALEVISLPVRIRPIHLLPRAPRLEVAFPRLLEIPLGRWIRAPFPRPEAFDGRLEVVIHARMRAFPGRGRLELVAVVFPAADELEQVGFGFESETAFLVSVVCSGGKADGVAC